MAKGKCKLCLLDKELRKSHFIGAGLYRIANKRGGAIAKTPKLFIRTDKQIQEYVLCGSCEQLFNKRGEDYVTRLVKQADGRFPLLEMLSKYKPVATGPNSGDRFSGAAVGVDMEKVAYYGLSMFWRASAHRWQVKILGQMTGAGAINGNDLENIRKYLHDEGGWPEGIVLQVIACTDSFSQDNVYPPCDWTNDMYKGSSMVIFGIFFELIRGVKPGAPEWNLCCMSTPEYWIFHASREKISRAFEEDIRSHAKIADNLRPKKKA